MIAWLDAPRPPRRWQAEALPLAVDALRSGRRCVVVAPPGAGKSTLIAELCHTALPRLGDRIAVVTTPTQRLVRQLAATIEERCPGSVGSYYADAKVIAPITVCCDDSALALASTSPRVAFWLADEVHRSEAPTMHAAVAALRPACALGVSATAFRSDPDERLRLWDDVCYRLTYADAVADGILVPYRVVHFAGGDKTDVDGWCEARLAEADGPGIISARSIADAEQYADRLPGVAAIHSLLPTRVQDERIRALESGALRALVHVAMLSEGVDLPWLRWLIMRRRVSSRVRLVQEIGRVLRAAPRKATAVLYDPYDLLGELGLHHAEALGDAPDKIEAPEPDEDFPLVELPPPGEDVPPMVAVDAVGAWALSLLLGLQAAGIATASTWDLDRDAGWRRRPPSDRQIVALRRLRHSTASLPEEHRGAARAVIDHADTLRAGVVGDLLSVLIVCAERRRHVRESAGRWHWPWPAGIAPVPALPGRVLVGIGVEPPKRRRRAA